MTVIAWEYERQRKKDLDKKAKEDAFRQALDQKYIDEKTVLRLLHQLLLSAAANRHTIVNSAVSGTDHRIHTTKKTGTLGSEPNVLSQPVSRNLQCQCAAPSVLDAVIM